MEIKNEKGIASYLHWGKEEIAFFSQYFSKVTFPQKTDFFYEGQIPCVGFYLVKGRVTLESHQRIVAYVHEGAVVGVRELITERGSKVRAILDPGSEVYILDKTTLNEIFSSPDEILERMVLH